MSGNKPEPEDIRNKPELADHATVVYIGSWWFGQWADQKKKPTSGEFSRFIFDLSLKTRPKT